MPRKPLILAAIVVALHLLETATLGTSTTGSLVANLLEVFARAPAGPAHCIPPGNARGEPGRCHGRRARGLPVLERQESPSSQTLRRSVPLRFVRHDIRGHRAVSAEYSANANRYSSGSPLDHALSLWNLLARKLEGGR